MKFGAKLLSIVCIASVFAGCSQNPSTTGNGSVTPPSATNAMNTNSSDQGTTGSGPGSKPGQPVAPPNSPPPANTPKPLVFFSQANSADPWRQVFDAEIKAEADRDKAFFDFEEQQANDDPSHQIDQIETELVKKPKVMLVSPATVAVQRAIEEAYDQGVHVILLDRSVPTQKYDCYVGGDNRAIGFQAGQYMGKRLNGKGTVLMIQGIADAPPTKDRANGFMDAMKQFPGIKVIAGENCDYQRAKAQTYMENYIQGHQPAFDAVYAHNDEMAIGAYQAMQSAHMPKKVIVSIDGCQTEVMNMIKEGKLDATFSYPDPGPKGLQVAMDILNGKTPPKKVTLSSVQITKDTVDAYVSQHPNLAK